MFFSVTICVHTVPRKNVNAGENVLLHRKNENVAEDVVLHRKNVFPLKGKMIRRKEKCY